LIKRLRKAIDQINVTGCPGAAYIDVTLAFNPENRRANEDLRQEQVSQTARTWMQQAFEPYREQVDRWMMGSKLTSIFLQFHIVIPIDGEVVLHSTVLTYPERVVGRYAKQDANIRRSIDFGWARV
jgi:hypothetical protein